jgi:hypothetical protein
MLVVVLYCKVSECAYSKEFRYSVTFYLPFYTFSSPRLSDPDRASGNEKDVIDFAFSFRLKTGLRDSCLSPIIFSHSYLYNAYVVHYSYHFTGHLFLKLNDLHLFSY